MDKQKRGRGRPATGHNRGHSVRLSEFHRLMALRASQDAGVTRPSVAGGIQILIAKYAASLAAKT